MAKIALLLGGNDGDKGFFNLGGILASGGDKAQASTDANAMGICYDGGAMINVAQEQIGNLAANAREGQKGIHAVR